MIRNQKGLGHINILFAILLNLFDTKLIFAFHLPQTQHHSSPETKSFIPLNLIGLV